MRDPQLLNISGTPRAIHRNGSYLTIDPGGRVPHNWQAYATAQHPGCFRIVEAPAPPPPDRPAPPPDPVVERASSVEALDDAVLDQILATAPPDPDVAAEPDPIGTLKVALTDEPFDVPAVAPDGPSLFDDPFAS